MADTQGSFRPIPAEECLVLLRSQVIGRIGWTDDDGLQLLPVTYALHDRTIVFRTSPYGPLAGLHRQQPAVFEVDAFDASTRTGWSVVVHGRARGITDPGDLVAVWRAKDPVPWAPGTRNLFIAVTLDQITGRTVVAGTPPEWLATDQAD
ncbi:pyridoxamine 5'-phosphate oxidase family protein [Microlunatus sp. GCM10028923]|uniref:pyridoxamine 5'-phosphate oxidase family protein n=1 Tax=Microlunatus sp. GCM10028923 TaxID=3273400 RepID=UPI003613B720